MLKVEFLLHGLYYCKSDACIIMYETLCSRVCWCYVEQVIKNIKNVTRCRDSRMAIVKKQGRDESIKQFSIQPFSLELLPLYMYMYWKEKCGRVSYWIVYGIIPIPCFLPFCYPCFLLHNIFFISYLYQYAWHWSKTAYTAFNRTPGSEIIVMWLFCTCL